MKPFFSIFIRYNPLSDHWVVLVKQKKSVATTLFIQKRLAGDGSGQRSLFLLRKKMSYFGLV